MDADVLYSAFLVLLVRHAATAPINTGRLAHALFLNLIRRSRRGYMMSRAIVLSLSLQFTGCQSLASICYCKVDKHATCASP